MKKKSLFILIGLVFLFSLLSFFNTYDKYESKVEDPIFQKSSELDPRIVILTVDDASLEKYGQWPWPRTYIAEAINKVSQGNAAAIGVDFVYSEEARTNEEDAALLNAVKNAGNVVMPLYGNFGNKPIKNGKLEPIYVKEPFPRLKEVSILGEINTKSDYGIVRKAITSFDYKNKKYNSFAIEVYNEFLKNTSKSKPKLNIPVDGWNRTFITFTTSPNSEKSEKNIDKFPIYKVLNGELSPYFFEDKIVLIGPYFSGCEDTYVTSINHDEPMYGIEIHANILQNLIDNNFKKYVPDWLNILILVFLASIAYIIFWRLKPLLSAVIMLAFISAYIFISKVIFSAGYIIQIIYPIALLIILYIVILASHYIEEFIEKKRVTNLFGKYVEPKVVNKILHMGEDNIKLGGERKMISVLFVDIRGFTSLSEKCTPEEVVEILNEYLDLTSKSILNNEGMLDKFIGDATMAIFNAPLDLEDHTFKAIKAAWEMKQGAQTLQQELLKKFGHTVQFGIGINTGYAIVGNIGSKSRMDYTAIGDTVNTSARLESNAKPNEILISDSTYELVKDRVNVNPLGEIKVKGKEQCITVYELIGIK